MLGGFNDDVVDFDEEGVRFIFNMIQFANWQAGEGLPKGRVLYCFGEVATIFSLAARFLETRMITEKVLIYKSSGGDWEETAARTGGDI